MKHSRCIQAKLIIQVHQRSNLPSTQCHPQDRHQRCSWPHQIGTEYADICSGPEVHPSVSRQSHGQSTLSSTLPHGCFYQRTNLVHQLQTNPQQSPFIHPPHQICWQPSHLRWLTSSWPPTIWSTVGWRLLRETNHPWNRTWPRVLGFMLETKPLELIYQGPTNISHLVVHPT